MAVRVIIWNLMHGRSVPPSGTDLQEEFAAVLAEWEWDLALLQEVPPWWPQELARRTGAEHRLVLTSRNALLPVRRTIATRWPDIAKSNGGGCNAILVRSGTVADHRVRLLRRLPERRWLHAVRITGLEGPLWAGNLHASVRNERAARREAHAAAATIVAWAAGEPALLGGDFNVPGLALRDFTHAGGHDVDHVFTNAMPVSGASEALGRGRLSDHAPVAVELSSASVRADRSPSA